MKRFDALITTQKTSALYKVAFLKKSGKYAQKLPFFQKCPFFVVFLDFFRNGTSQRAEVFLRCDQGITTLHLSYQTARWRDFHFSPYNGGVRVFRPLVRGVKIQF